MGQTILARRSFLITGAALVATAVVPGVARAGTPVLHVMKDPGCGCCDAWIDILRRDSFEVTAEHIAHGALLRFKRANGIPDAMASCHTGRIGGYMIEGHVPAADIRRLLDERPDAVGLAVPGMPWGSPGMGPEAEREAYDVHLILRDGRTEVFTRHEAA